MDEKGEPTIKEMKAKESKASLVIKLITTCVICVTVIVALLIIVSIFRGEKNATVESLNMVLSQRFEEKSEWITNSLIYPGVRTVTDGEIPVLTKQSVTILYTAEIKAGVSPKDIKVKSVTDKTVTISVPRSKIISKAIDTTSVKLLNEKSAVLGDLFGDKMSEIVIKAEALAQENVDKLISGEDTDDLDNNEKLDIEGLLKGADENLEEQLCVLFEGAIGDRKIVIDWQ